MIGQTKAGKYRSERTKEESKKIIKDMWGNLSDDEKRAVRILLDDIDQLASNEVGFDNTNDVKSVIPNYDLFSSVHYDGNIVSVDEFIMSPYYLGAVGEYLYPQWRRDLTKLFSDDYDEAVITGSLGGGKCIDGCSMLFDHKTMRNRKVSDIVGEDIVLSCSDNGVMTVSEAKVFQSGMKKLGKLSFPDGSYISVTGDHRVLTKEGWVIAREIKDGDMVARCNHHNGYVHNGDLVFYQRSNGYVENSRYSPVYDITVPGDENFVLNGVIVHNSTFCEIALAYIFYKIIMLKNPQPVFSLMPGSSIVLACFNRDQSLARTVTFGGLKAKLELSPFFKGMVDRREIVIKNNIVSHVKGIDIIPVSVKSAGALGKDVFGCIIDESDFVEGSSISGKGKIIGEKPFVENFYENIRRRIKSRFNRKGAFPGMIILSSSAKNVSSFTNTRIKESLNDPMVFCRDYAIYEVKPKEQFSDEVFHVLIGTDRIKHKVFTSEEFNELSESYLDEMEKLGCRFIDVPMDFYREFTKNTEDSLRDISGICTLDLHPFFQMPNKIFECIDERLFHPMGSMEWTTGNHPFVDWGRICVQKKEKIGRTFETYLTPRLHPDAPRHVHIDLSLGKTDAAGICIAHTYGSQIVSKYVNGEDFFDELPVIYIDLFLRVLAPENEEIDIAVLRSLVYMFRDHGYHITIASMDSFQSAESLQHFRNNGIKADLVSVDKTTTPYEFLKSAMYDGRVRMYEHPTLINELKSLQKDEIKAKVDHPKGGSKDIADALAGVCYTLMREHTKGARGILEMSNVVEFKKEHNDSWIRGDQIIVPDKEDTDNPGPLLIT